MSEENPTPAEQMDAHITDLFDSAPDDAPVEDVSAPVEQDEEVSAAAPSYDDDGSDDEAPSGEEERPQSRAQKRIVNLAKERDAEREKVIRMEERFRAYVEASQRNAPAEAAPEPDPIPEYDDDPAGHLQAKINLLEQQAAYGQQQAAQQQQVSQQQQHTQAVAQRFNTEEQAYAADKPDYFPAVEALKAQRMAMWQSAGHTEQQAAQAVAQEAFQIVSQASSAGRNASEIFYEMARNVYSAPANPPPAPNGAAMHQNPATLAQRAKPKRPGSLGTRGGGEAPKATSLADLANMSDAEFSRATTGDAWEDMHRRANLV
tara:strand:- start:409 stop:1362 length:954 start_codon:yes stop_codon:yes gene_type:complete